MRSIATDSIDLAEVPVFRIGAIEVRPSLRELGTGAGARLLEPRVMQVLVALADAGGGVVSRDMLATRCWEGRIVGEDALNRVIAKLRAAGADGLFTIETVKKVGYRLVPGTPPTTPPADVAAPTTSLRWRTGAALLAAAGFAIAGFVFREPAPPPPTPERMPQAATDFETRGLSAVFEGTPERTAEGVSYLQQATARAPQSAPVWGSLAMGYVLSLPFTEPSAREAVAARAREAAGHAQSIDRREGRSLAALVSLQPTYRAWDAKHRALTRALAQSRPGAAPLQFQNIQFLMATGRTTDALTQVEALAAASPLVPWIQSARANLLAAAGRPDDAERVAAWAAKVWPRDRLTWFTRFYLLAYSGKPAAALALAADATSWPTGTDREEVRDALLTAQALASRTPAAVDAAMARWRLRALLGQGNAEQGLRAAAALDQPADAMAFARALYGGGLPHTPRSVMLARIGLEAPDERDTAVLFLPPVVTLWASPAFAEIAAQTGLPGYWRRTGLPDLCGAAQAPAFLKDRAPRRWPALT